jgi:hypothetical protein
MPNKRTKTSLVPAKNVYAVPEICISKPTGVNCSLVRYNCDGKFAGVANYGPTTLEQCQFIKNAQTNCYGTMIYNNPPQKVFVQEEFYNCPIVPIIVTGNAYQRAGYYGPVQWEIWNNAGGTHYTNTAPDGWLPVLATPEEDWPSGLFQITLGSGAEPGSWHFQYYPAYRYPDNQSFYWDILFEL